jgi:hypothetical protein
MPEGSKDKDQWRIVEAGLAGYRVCKASHRGNEEPPSPKLGQVISARCRPIMRDHLRQRIGCNRIFLTRAARHRTGGGALGEGLFRLPNSVGATGQRCPVTMPRPDMKEAAEKLEIRIR